VRIIRANDDGPGSQPGPSPGALWHGRRVDYPSPHFEMSCGHTTTIEVQEGYAIWRPKDKDFYCEHWPRGCGWVKAKRKAKPKPQPTEPLF
jgi:hypothetical protein